MSDCYFCGGSGYVITCIDDMCHGMDECIHGDGESECPVCRVRDDDYEKEDGDE
jgi:hypothetical protein